jgi:maleylacetate reductase
MDRFIFEIARLRVLFGAGRRADLPAEIDALGLRRALIIADPSLRAVAQELSDLLGSRSAGIHDQVVQHVPVAVAAAGAARAREVDADCTVCIGGGSATGLAKAITLETGLPIVALPTTYAGSEMTPIWGTTAEGEKRTGRDPRVQPRVALYDSELVAGLPPQVAGPSGMNALAHSVEALYAQNANPMMSSFGQESIRALAEALPKVVRNPRDLGAQSQAQYGACLAGILLGNVGMALHHKLCHVLGGSFNTPHAETHAVILPHVTAFNVEGSPDARSRLQAALGKSDVAYALWELGRATHAPRSLADLGLRESDLDRAAELATRTPYFNPRPVTRESIRKLLGDAFAGVAPHA